MTEVADFLGRKGAFFSTEFELCVAEGRAKGCLLLVLLLDGHLPISALQVEGGEPASTV